MSTPTNTTDEPKDTTIPDGDTGKPEDDNPSGDEPNNNNEEMITVAEAQKRADAQVAKKLKGMPTKAEIAEFRQWKESQKTDEEKRAEAEKRYSAIEAENTTLKQEKQVLARGVKFDDIDYVCFKVGKMEGDFEENLEKFLADNPKYINGEEDTQPKRTGTSVTNTNQPKTSGVDEILKKRNPNLNI